MPGGEHPGDRLAGATTTIAVEAAKTGGLTIVGFVRSKKMNIYTGWERVRGVPPPVDD